ncbi:MAG: hypothetical protein ACLFWB_10370 [Armatimonadota bacterium]
MTKRDWTFAVIGLLLLTVGLHYAHYLIFQDLHHVLIYMFGDIAFVPLEVLLVTLVLDRVLQARERQERQYKMNMVIGVFFGEVGRPLLRLMNAMVDNIDTIAQNVAMRESWGQAQMDEAVAFVENTDFVLEADPDRLEEVRDFLAGKREFMARLLENPYLLERETFSGVLWALYHLEEELSARGDFHELPQSDLAHLAGDTDRAYTRLVIQWVHYMDYLQDEYPYLYSFARRTNPFIEEASVEVA